MRITKRQQLQSALKELRDLGYRTDKNLKTMSTDQLQSSYDEVYGWYGRDCRKRFLAQQLSHQRMCTVNRQNVIIDIDRQLKADLEFNS